MSNLLCRKGRPEFHVNKVSLGYLNCNVQFCVGKVEIFERSGLRSI